MGEKIKAKAVKTTTDLWKAAQTAAALLVAVALTRAAIVTWYNDQVYSGFPLDRMVAGVTLALVLCYFVWLHYKK